MSLSPVSLSFPFPKFLVMLSLHYVFVFQCDSGCFHLPLQTSLVSASPRVYFQRRKSSFGFIASPFATYGLLKCEFWGLLGDFPESSCQPSRKTPWDPALDFSSPLSARGSLNSRPQDLLSQVLVSCVSFGPRSPNPALDMQSFFGDIFKAVSSFSIFDFEKKITLGIWR